MALRDVRVRLRASPVARNLKSRVELVAGAVRYPRDTPEWAAVQLLRGCRPDVVVDVGANVGQFARTIRSFGYAGDIVSFEPVSSTYRRLAVNADDDPHWYTVNCALGAAEGEATINISSNDSLSSSLLPMEDLHRDAFPGSGYVASEPVRVRRLDDVEVPALAADRVFLKVDAQGFEHEVVAGAEDLLGRTVGIQLELSLAPLYSGGWTFWDAMDWLRDQDFQPHHFVPGVVDRRTMQTLQVDVIGLRR